MRGRELSTTHKEPPHLNFILCARQSREHIAPVKMGVYEGNPDWADIEPLPQEDGGVNVLAAIAYSEEYSDAMSYLRAVMAKNEFSERVLRLTEHIIDMNPAHYTIWYDLHSFLK